MQQQGVPRFAIARIATLSPGNQESFISLAIENGSDLFQD
jgi:hypothetical protein